MKFRCKRKEVLAALSVIKSVIPRKHNLPILTNVLIQAKDNIVAFTGTDLNDFVKHTISADIVESGDVTASIKELYSIIKGLQNEDIEIESIGNNITIICGQARFEITGISASEYPIFPDVKELYRFSINIDTLQLAFDKTSFAVDNEDNRYALQGVRVKGSVAKSCLNFIAADGKRLVYLSDIPCKVNLDFAITIHSRTIKRLKGFKGELVNVIIGKYKILFQTENTKLVSTLIDAQFPDYEQVIPKNITQRIPANTMELLQAIQQLSPKSRKDGPYRIRLQFSPGRYRLTLNWVVLV